MFVMFGRGAANVVEDHRNAAAGEFVDERRLHLRHDRQARPGTPIWAATLETSCPDGSRCWPSPRRSRGMGAGLDGL